MNNLILIAVAVIPALYLLVRVYRADRLEKEPAGLLISLLVLGVVVTFLASITEELGQMLLASLFPEGGILYAALLYFVVVALSEEGFKYLLLKLRTWKSPDFNCQFDGVVYAVFISMGFALWENIAYVMRFGFGTAVARAVTAIPGHACFGVYMGVWYGAAKRCELAGLDEEAALARKRSLLIPVLLHGAYDFIATMQNDIMSILFLVFISWMFRAALKVVREASARDVPLVQDGPSIRYEPPTASVPPARYEPPTRYEPPRDPDPEILPPVQTFDISMQEPEEPEELPEE